MTIELKGLISIRLLAVMGCVILSCAQILAQRSSGPARGILIVDGGGATALVRDRFLSLAGGAKARIIVIPTGASSLRFGEKNTILDPDWPRDRPEWAAYEEYLKQWFGTENVTVLHTRDREVANSADFVIPLLNATGVFLA